MPYQTLSPFVSILLFLVIGVFFLNALLLVSGILQDNGLTKREKKAVRGINLLLLGWTIITWLAKEESDTPWLVASVPYLLIIAVAAGIVVATYRGVSRR